MASKAQFSHSGVAVTIEHDEQADTYRVSVLLPYKRHVEMRRGGETPPVAIAAELVVLHVTAPLSLVRAGGQKPTADRGRTRSSTARDTKRSYRRAARSDAPSARRPRGRR